MSTAAERTDAVTALLAAPPQVPRDPDLFTSGVRFGVPGTYPTGSPMAPAAGNPIGEEGARTVVGDLVSRRAPTAVARALGAFDDPTVGERVPDPVVRAALALLTVTVAAPLVDDFLVGSSPVTDIGIAPMPGSGRTFGRVDGARPGVRALNDRYAAEHPAVVAPSLAHHLGWQDLGDRYEEVVLHAILAMVHLQWTATDPSVAHLGTELTRRQNSMALTLLNSRHPGSPSPAVRADDGVGTLPGGDPGLDTPDFWSVPLAPGSGCGTAVPAPVTSVLQMVAAPTAPVPEPLRYDDDLSTLMTRDLGDTWADPSSRLRAAYALGAVGPAAVVGATGRPLDAALGWLGLSDVERVWSAGAPPSLG